MVLVRDDELTVADPLEDVDHLQHLRGAEVAGLFDVLLDDQPGLREPIRSLGDPEPRHERTHAPQLRARLTLLLRPRG